MLGTLQEVKDTFKTLVVSDELELGVSVPLPPLKSHFPGLYLNTVPRGSIQNNIPFDAFMLAQINPCMICINDTHLVIWRNALIFRTCWKT